MSYDLVFFRPRARGPVTREQADEVFALRPCFDRQREGKGGWVYAYENPDTEVAFSFELDGEAAGAPGPEAGDDADIAAGLTFELSFCRPSFFAAEAMPIVAEVAWALEVKIMDPQDEGASDPRVRNAQALERTWLAGNAWACSVAARAPGSSARYAPRALLDEWWRTMRARRALQRRVDEGDYVPRLLLLARRDGRPLDGSAVRRAVVWAAEGSFILPEAADLVHVAEPGPGRLVPASAVRDILREHLVPIERAEAPVSRWDGTAGREAILARLAGLAGEPLSAFEALDAHLVFDALPAPEGLAG